MTTLLWLLIIGLFFLVFLLYKSAAKADQTCGSCHKYHEKMSTLIKCEKCRRMICIDNLEFIDQTSINSTIHIDILLSKKNTEHPCGALFRFDGSIHYYCKADIPRFIPLQNYVYKK